MIKFGIFFIISILLLFFTVLRSQRYRFYRFFAFESLLILVLLNSDQWFDDPISFIQLISWFFLFISLILAVHGFMILKTGGSPKKDIEDTTELVVAGAYKYIRHPLYCSLFLAGIGAFLKDPNIYALLLLLLLFIFVFLTAKFEERDNLLKFGSAYREYMEKTKMFIPLLV